MTHPADSLADYVVGGLTPGEASRVREHLEGCEACRAETRAVGEALESVVHGLVPVQPPPGAWARIQARVRPPGRTWWPWAAAAGLAVVLAGGAGWTTGLERARELALADESVVARWLGQPGLQHRPFVAYGRNLGGLLLLPQGRALLVLREPPPPGRVYQAWGMDELSYDAAATPLAVGTGRVIELRWEGHRGVWLSHEPPGGSPSPTEPLGWVELPDA